jgi:hypothetical protein
VKGVIDVINRITVEAVTLSTVQPSEAR